ncbi:uncharacterized protein LOC108237705 [Kryptolebias marmoratus]|uniref:Uncharacterized LOC108237705 n=1 Tax=Kryptolebias marmoratus TaxID=37003 RepID=A0A3Q3FA02_KRYMA|nr:uncharacterized protein LOC108237705 [Kryptolebias marmoratus]
MHWLPLVAMVIASALPFPHNPETTQPGSSSRRDPAARLAAAPVDYSLRGNASRTDDSTAGALSTQNLQNRKGSVKSLVHDTQETSTAKVENQITYQTFGISGTDDRSRVSLDASSLRTEEISEDNSLPEDYRADGSSSRKVSSGVLDFSKDHTQQDSTDSPLQVSTVENYDVVSPATMLKGQRRLEPTAPSVGNVRKSRTGARTSAGLTLEAGLGLRAGLDGLLEDDVFLNTQPRVLFSSSPSPPEHPPLLLMLESGLLEEDGDGDEQEDPDRHTEGHGDAAVDRSTTPSWADYSRAPSEETDHPMKRDKRSQPIDRRRGEKAVCEAENVWVTDKKTATDSHGQTVTILPEIQTQSGPVKQYFYETRCRQAEQRSSPSKTKGTAGRAVGTGVAGAECFGVDNKQWHSECKVRQTYVRALTKDANNRTGWRWIRIDSSCVCVLLSRSKGKEVLLKRGRG